MWCKDCKIETLDKTCPVCGSETIEDIPTEVYYCTHCHTPIIKRINDAQKDICPLCQEKMKYLTADLRPVFPEERRLLELLLNKEPYSLRKASVWANKNRYYIDGKGKPVTNSIYTAADVEKLQQALAESRMDEYDEAFQ